jgi:GNAT superfamily N-acetyltransferase
LESKNGEYFLEHVMPTLDQHVQTGCYLRPADSADEDFLLDLYAQERREELMLAGLDAKQRETFVKMQFHARQSGYAASYPTASSEVLCAEDGSPIGRLLIDRSAGVMRVVDIALTESRQKQGLGGQLLQQLQKECRALGHEMRLQVLKYSPAVRLYRRLGFEIEGSDLLRWQMVWNKARD